MPAFPIGTASFTSTPFPGALPLLSDGDDIVSRTGTVALGIGVLKRGTIINIVPDTGVITVPTTVAGCNGIIVDDVDSTLAQVTAGVYLTGKFKADAIFWPGALNHALVTEQLRDAGIYIESVVTGPGTTAKSVPTAAEAAEAQRRLDAARGAEKKAEEEVVAEAPPPSDSLWPYLTPEERETREGTNLVELGQTLAAQEEEGMNVEGASVKKTAAPPPSHQTKEPPKEAPKPPLRDHDKK